MDVAECYIKHFLYRRYDVSDPSDVAKELTIDLETILNHLKEVGYKKRAYVSDARD